jgi:hypothetical protein
MEIEESLKKYNKLKRFGDFVSGKIGEVVAGEIGRVDCLFNDDIYTKRDMWEKLDSIAACASVVELRKYDTGEIKIHNANYCHNPVVCPICADRVSKRRRAIFTEPIKRAVRRFAVDRCSGDWKSEYPEGYTGVYLATATIKDGEKLKERIDTLQDSVKRMRKMGQKRKDGHSRGEWSKVRAAISNVEMKIGSGSGAWHVHNHFLIFTDSPINIKTRESEYFIDKGSGERLQVSKFNYEWWTATGGEGINFDVRPVQFRKIVGGRECKTFSESVEAQAQEVIKYSAQLTAKKGTSILMAAQYVELIQRRGNRRLFNAIGLLRCDKRNPESFMTVTERELRRLEYVNSMDCKTYEIYSSLWQYGGTYGQFKKQDAAIFSNSDEMNTRFIHIRRRTFLAQTAIYQGEYRKERNGLLKSREFFEVEEKTEFEQLLNETKDNFRNKVSSLWQHFKEKDFTPDFLTDWNSTGLQGFREKHLKAA